MYVKVSASTKRLLQVADIMGKKGMLKLRLKKGSGERNEGAWCQFRQFLKSEYEESSESASSLFSSLQQIRILEFILNDTDKMAMGPQLVYKEHMQPGYTPLELLAKDGKIRSHFRMHHEKTRQELKKMWVDRYTDKQPIEQIREYFGEKIALYFVFLGFYTTMLWIPALCGVVLTFTQMYSRYKTGSMDNPWVPLYCCFITIWAIAFTAGWKRLERSYQYEWDTLAFEEEEEDRREFIIHPSTDAVQNEFTGEVVFQPRMNERNWALVRSAVVVSIFIALVVAVVSGVALLKFRLVKILAPYGLSFIGKGVGGAMQASSIMAFNIVYKYVLKKLTDDENWKTATQYEDATIAKDFCFKLVNAYFACFFVAFVQNNFKVYGYDLHCPEWHCMQDLTTTLAAVFLIQMTVAQVAEVGGPKISAWWKNSKLNFCNGEREVVAPEENEPDGKKKCPQLSEVEEQETQLAEYPQTGVFEEYQEMVVQYGYVTLFAAAFPLTSALALMNNLVEIRTDAFKLLMFQRRPPYMCAADIGTWQVILDILTTCSVLTNCALVGFTSHGLFFYFPKMIPVQRVWITIICEHVLLFLKLLVDTCYSDTDKEVLDKYKRREKELEAMKLRSKCLAPDDTEMPFFTDEEGDLQFGH